MSSDTKIVEFNTAWVLETGTTSKYSTQNIWEIFYDSINMYGLWIIKFQSIKLVKQIINFKM